MNIIVGILQLLFLAFFADHADWIFTADPGTLLLVVLGAQATSMAMQANAAKESAKAAMDANKFNARRTEEEIRRRRAADLKEQHIRREQARRMEKSLLARVGKSGVQLEGSLLVSILQAVEDSASDIATIAGERAAVADSLRYQMGASIYAAKDAERSGKLGVAQSLVGGVGDMASTGMRYKLLTGGTPGSRPVKSAGTRSSGSVMSGKSISSKAHQIGR